MKFGSLFDGIYGFGLGLESVGFEPAWRSEIEPNCNKLMEQRRPGIPSKGDIRDLGRHNLEPVDIIVGGFPCQDVSVAGKRAGLAGERSGLWFEYHRILAELGPEWVVIENVPGLLSSCGCPTCGAMRRILRIHTYLRRKRKIHKSCAVCHAAGRLLKSHRGRDFAILLRGLVELGYGVAWRVLDSQYFGLAQRRKRVFIIGHLGDGAAAEILFEPESGDRDTSPRKKAGQRVAAPLTRGSATGSGVNEPGRRREDDENLVTAFAWQQGVGENDRAYPVRVGDYAGALSSSRQDAVAITPRGEGHDASEDGTGRQNLIAAPLTARHQGESDKWPPINEADNLITGAVSSKWAKGTGGPAGDEVYNLVAPTLSTKNEVASSSTQREKWYEDSAAMFGAVRRLTPTECERLQGFPDGWTEGFADSVRYRMLGNAVAVPVIAWLARRIAAIQIEFV